MALHATMMTSLISMLPFGSLALAFAPSTFRAFASTFTFTLSLISLGTFSLGGVMVPTIWVVATITSSKRRSKGSTFVVLALLRVRRPGFGLWVLVFRFRVKVHLLCFLLLALDLLLWHIALAYGQGALSYEQYDTYVQCTP